MCGTVVVGLSVVNILARGNEQTFIRSERPKEKREQRVKIKSRNICFVANYMMKFGCAIILLSVSLILVIPENHCQLVLSYILIS